MEEIKEFREVLERKTDFLKISLVKDNPLTQAEFQECLKEVVALTQAIHRKVKEFNTLLPKDSPQRTFWIRAANAFPKIIGKQQKVFINPSDANVNLRQEAKRKTLANLQALKIRESVRVI